MNKQQYLSFGHVPAFVEFFSKLISGANFRFPHSYSHVQAKRNFKFNNLGEAYAGYWFPLANDPIFLVLGNAACRCIPSCGFGPNGRRTCIGASNAVLLDIQQKLASAINSMSANQAEIESIRLMKWGGTENGNNQFLSGLNGNVELIPAQGNHGVVLYFNNVSSFFNSQSLDVMPFTLPTGFRLRSNAGFTKIYSLICDNFVIYDSRVAAALGMFVVDYCVANGLLKVPQELNFGSMGAKGGQLRSPDVDSYTFRSAATVTAHAESNVMSNWIIAASLVMAGGNFCGKQGNNAMRAVESALFSVGYDLTDAIRRRSGQPLPTAGGAAAATNSRVTGNAGASVNFRDIARNIWRENPAVRDSRQGIMQLFVDAGINRATASTYYADLKAGRM